MTPVSGTSSAARPPAFTPPTRASQEASLRATAKQLQGVFVNQLMQAMRSTIPEGGLTDGGPGEETFRGMLDEHLSEQWTARLDGPNSLAEALFRQLRAKLPAQSGESGLPEGAPAPSGADTDSMTAPRSHVPATR